MTGKRLGLAATLLLCVTLAGCGSFHKVTDPASGEIYYTKKVKKLNGGAVRFTDQATDTKVTIQNSQVSKIKKKEYKQGLKDAKNPPAAPATETAPAPAATPAPAAAAPATPAAPPADAAAQ